MRCSSLSYSDVRSFRQAGLSPANLSAMEVIATESIAGSCGLESTRSMGSTPPGPGSLSANRMGGGRGARELALAGWRCRRFYCCCWGRRASPQSRGSPGLRRRQCAPASQYPHPEDDLPAAVCLLPPPECLCRRRHAVCGVDGDELKPLAGQRPRRRVAPATDPPPTQSRRTTHTHKRQRTHTRTRGANKSSGTNAHGVGSAKPFPSGWRLGSSGPGIGQSGLFREHGQPREPGITSGQHGLRQRNGDSRGRNCKRRSRIKR